MEVNLDEYRAAKTEAREEEVHAIVFHGERFPLPVRLPIAVAEHLATYLVLSEKRRKSGAGTDVELEGTQINELLKAAGAILGTEGYERFKALGADYEDVMALITATIRLFKLGEDLETKDEAAVLGESGASDSLSSDSGASSRPTGDASTEGTSSPTSSGPVPSPSGASAS